MMVTEQKRQPPGRGWRFKAVLVWVDPAYACSPSGARMPRPTFTVPASYTRPAVDGAKLKAAADRLADLLNDLRAEDWHLNAGGDSHSWSIVQAPGGAGSAKASVLERVDGRWETVEVKLPLTPERRALADRLRALAAEVEAL